MQTTHLANARHSGGNNPAMGARALGLLISAILLASVGCGPAQDIGSEDVAQQLGALSHFEGEDDAGRISTNGMSVNGMSVNGMSVNGMSVNGMSVNGLTPEALRSEQFAAWFQSDPEANDMMMQYVVRCGLEKKKSLRYVDAVTGQKYVWEGLLGLTPGWAKGKPASETEEQLLTACLAAHANKYGVHIGISVLGADAKGRKIHYSREELATYSRPEACFFGNLYAKEGIYVGSDRAFLDSTESTARACGLTSAMEDASSECPPFIHIGSCSDVCELDKSGLYYTRCTLNGKEYKPITTRLKPEDVYQCGDGVCQFTERCGSGTTWDSCQADCGTCDGN